VVGEKFSVRVIADVCMLGDSLDDPCFLVVGHPDNPGKRQGFKEFTRAELDEFQSHYAGVKGEKGLVGEKTLARYFGNTLKELHPYSEGE